MAKNIKLKDYTAVPQTYNNVSKIKIPLDGVQEGFAEFVPTPSGSFNIQSSYTTNSSQQNNYTSQNIAPYETVNIYPVYIPQPNASDIRSGVSVLGVIGTYEGAGGIVPSGNIELTDAFDIYDVSQYATAQIVDNNLIPENIAEGQTILGVSGELIPSPSWLPSSNSKDNWEKIYVNTQYTFLGQPFWRLLAESYLEYNNDFNVENILTIRHFDENHRGEDIGQIVLIKHNLNVISASIVQSHLTPIYALQADNFSVEIDEITYTLNVKAGWNNTTVALPPGGGRVTSFWFDIVAGEPYAFGDYIKPPTSGTLTITQNGVYTFEELSKYKNIIINIPTNALDTNLLLGDNALIFGDNTSVSNETLILTEDNAEIFDNTLIFINDNEESLVEDNDLILNLVETAINNDTLQMDGIFNNDTLILN